jgi:hypothetical protein
MTEPKVRGVVATIIGPDGHMWVSEGDFARSAPGGVQSKGWQVYVIKIGHGAAPDRALDERIALRARVAELEAKNDKLRVAVRPLAAIPICRDDAGKEYIRCGYDAGIELIHVKAAVLALEQREG